MIKTTLVYIEENNQYLMLLRDKKKNDPNSGKWIGIGGHIEDDETPDECMLREVYEETGLNILQYEKRGIIQFLSNEYESEQIFLYTASSFQGTIINCDEGTLRWVDKSDIFNLNLWEGDKLFLKELIDESPYFEMDLEYMGDTLINSNIKYIE